jgi:hypothetical protein
MQAWDVNEFQRNTKRGARRQCARIAMRKRRKKWPGFFPAIAQL